MTSAAFLRRASEIYEKRLCKPESEKTEVDSAACFKEFPGPGKWDSQINNQPLAGSGTRRS